MMKSTRICREVKCCVRLQKTKGRGRIPWISQSILKCKHKDECIVEKRKAYTDEE